MTGEALYERYKDALKRGHVASLHGHLEEALTAYAEAAAIAPERSTPHASAGTALMRRKRPADALRHYAAALTLAPRDETAMLGRAQALGALDRRSEAAVAFDALAELRTTSGKLADAVDAARRGLELAEGRERRRTLERLIERLRASEPGEPGRLAMERALQVLDGPAVPPPPTPVAPAAAEEPEDREAPQPPRDPRSGVAEPVPAASGGDMPTLAIASWRAALDRDLPAEFDVEGISRAAEDAVARGATDEALGLHLDLAAAYWRDGRIDAALDACYLALSLDPDDVSLHLALVELYDGHGWGALATEKLDLLDRLVALDVDGEAANRVAAVRLARG